jgi:hypothetical protein
MIVLWGCVLVVMAYPFKRLLIKGNLNHFMSLGADVGADSMNGASTGWSSTNKTIWKLRDDFGSDEYGKISLDNTSSDLTATQEQEEEEG